MPVKRVARLSAALGAAFVLALLVAATGNASRPRNDPVILAAGDISCSSFGVSASACHAMATSDLIGWESPAAVLTLGDNQYESGTLSAFDSYFDQNWGRFKNLIYPSVGNHEYKTAGAAGYFNYFGYLDGVTGKQSRGYYSYDVGSWHIIALNSNIARDSSSAQVAWLKNDLVANPARCTLAYWHHPRWSSGAEHGNDASVGPFVKALYAAHADLFLTAHDHIYERFAPQTPRGVADWSAGIRAFIVGTGGKSHYHIGTVQRNSQIRQTSVYGVLRLVLHPDSYEWRFVPESGQSWTDYGTGECV